jgi:Mlc titration factor MtfA (ptsG expression regulator)
MDEAKRGAADPADGANLVLHEFAHQLDFEDRETDGAPALRRARNIWRGPE